VKIQDDGLVIEAGPGSRQQALEYGIARLREREKTKRAMSVLVALLVVAAGALVLFAPTGRETLSYVLSPVILVIAIGAIGATRFTLKTHDVTIKVED